MASILNLITDLVLEKYVAEEILDLKYAMELKERIEVINKDIKSINYQIRRDNMDSFYIHNNHKIHTFENNFGELTIHRVSNAKNLRYLPSWENYEEEQKKGNLITLITELSWNVNIISDDIKISLLCLEVVGDYQDFIRDWYYKVLEIELL